MFEQRLADLLPSDKRREFQADVKEIMNRRHILDFGDGYQSETKTIVKGGKYFTWTGAQLTRGSGIDNADQSPAVNFADDPWGVYAIVALHYELPQDAIQNAFLATRSHMQSDDFGMTPMPGLAATIQQMRSKGIHAVLITNSPEPDSMAILHKLGLSSVFEQKTFNAKKQVNAPSYFQQLQNQYQIPYPQMVSIGDHYRNEIAPAIKLGMQTICIDRYQIIERPDVTVQVRHPNQISSVLKAILE